MSRAGRGLPRETAPERLARLLAMVPWLLHRQGIDIAEAARQLGVPEQQIVQDLELLFVCGTPGHYPDDLIEASWEGGRVHVGNAAEISRPLRLARDEALALVVALRALAAVPGIGRHDAIDRALAKLEAAAGEVAGATEGLSVDLGADDREVRWLPELKRALGESRRVHLRYLVASRDEATERDVDPMRVLNVDGRWYLEAWCHRAVGVRLFRVDRIERLEVLDEDGTPPPEATPRDVGAGLFRPDPGDEVVVLELDPGATWVAESFPTEHAERRGDGGMVVHLRTADDTWVARLVWRLGGRARVLAPPELRQRVVDGARTALEGSRRTLG